MHTDSVRLELSGQREGFALAGALLAMVVVGALITGSFFAASQENAIGLSSRYNDAALYTAEYGLNQAVQEVSNLTLRALTQDTLLPPKWAVVNNDTIGLDSVWIRPSGPNRLFVSKGVATGGDRRYAGATRVLALMTHTVNINFPTDRAMQVLGGLTAKGNSYISGRDTFPQSPSQSQWADCGPGNGTQASVVAKDTTQVTAQGSAQYIGNKVQDPSLDSTSFLNFGGITYDQLAALASKVYPANSNVNPAPVGTATTCAVSVTDNWGEPGLPLGSSSGLVPGCKNYFPVIHVLGNMILPSGGRGQGILLVDGNLQISGGFEFWGITVVKGNLTSTGTGGHLDGVVLAMDSTNVDIDNVAVGNSVVELSSCAVKRAAANIPGFNVAIPLRTHSFLDLTAAGAGF